MNGPVDGLSWLRSLPPSEPIEFTPPRVCENTLRYLDSTHPPKWGGVQPKPKQTRRRRRKNGSHR